MRNRIPAALVVLAGAIVLGVYARSVHAPLLSDDGYQYLDAARSAARGECFCTHVAHFDEQIAAGRFPVEFTHFGPAYPLLVALLGKLGMPFEDAAFLLSAAGFLLALWFFWDIASQLGAKPWAGAALSLLWIFNTQALVDGVKVGTEALFTAAVTAMAALLVRDLRYGGGRPVWLAIFGLLAGFAYADRYAGLFVLPPAALYLAWRGWRTRAARPGSVAGLAAMAAIVGAVMIHNQLAIGSWRGGFSAGAGRSVSEVLIGTYKSYYHLIFGDLAVARADVWAGLFCLSVLAVTWLLFRARARLKALPSFAIAAYAWLLLLIACYAGGIMLTALLTIAADMTRYNRPVYPLALALIAPLFSAGLSGWRAAPALTMVAAILAIHSRSFVPPLYTTPDAQVSGLLSSDLEPGVTGRAWLFAHAHPGMVIAATHGQAVSYLLHIDTVSLIEPRFSSFKGEERDYHAMMTRERARYLVLFPGLHGDEIPEQDHSPFLFGLASGASPSPSWLHEDARNSAVAIYECSDCVK